MVVGARESAARVSELILSAARERPRLWSYDASKLTEELAAEGLDRASALMVRDGRGRAVPIELRSKRSAMNLLWGQSEVMLDGNAVATVWIGADTRALNKDTAQLAVLFATLALVLGLILYGLPIRTIRRSELRAQSLVTQLGFTLREDERRRIARELHDGAGQALTAARLRLIALKRALPNPGAIDAIAAHIDEAIDEVRRSTVQLAPPQLDELGLHGALERHCRAFGEAAGIVVQCQIPAALPPLERPIEMACYRIVQEALTNTARHSGATEAWVRVGSNRELLTLEVGDNGRGLADDTTRGNGLDSIRERAKLIGGNLTLYTAPMRLELIVPLGSQPS
jgi:signal transduction histidine kinase